METEKMKIEIDVPANIMKFFEAISKLTGRSVKEILEDGGKSECENILGCWVPELCSVEELRKRYDF